MTTENNPLTIQGDSATMTLTPPQSGLHSMELSVSAQTAVGLTIDRAAVLMFEAQPTTAPALFPDDGFPPFLLDLILLPLLVLLFLPILILLLLF